MGGQPLWLYSNSVYDTVEYLLLPCYLWPWRRFFLQSFSPFLNFFFGSSQWAINTGKIVQKRNECYELLQEISQNIWIFFAGLFSLEFPKCCTFYDFRAQMWDIAVWSKTHKNSVRGETGVLLSFSRDIDLQWSNFCHKKISNLFPLLFLQFFSELLSWSQKDWG